VEDVGKGAVEPVLHSSQTLDERGGYGLLAGEAWVQAVREEEFGIRGIAEGLPQVDNRIFPGYLAHEPRDLLQVLVTLRWSPGGDRSRAVLVHG
jgi:hypothetical protein